MNFIQKIRDYGFQKFMKEYYKESRDLWMSATIAKARELELMSKVADNWQAKAKHANTIAEQVLWDNAVIGRRLKFSVGHNHIEIIVGNPVTACKLFNGVDELYFDSFSLCNQKDQYDWKKGSIQALTNLMDNWLVDGDIDRAEWFNKLFKKYPELKAK